MQGKTLVVSVTRSITDRAGCLQSFSATWTLDDVKDTMVKDTLEACLQELDTALRTRIEQIRQAAATLPTPAPTGPPPRQVKRAELGERPRVNRSPCSQKQKACIHALARERGIDLREWLEGEIGTASCSDLTMSEASTAIDLLRDMDLAS